MPSGIDICLEPLTLLIPPGMLKASPQDHNPTRFSGLPGGHLIHQSFHLPWWKTFPAGLRPLRTEFDSPAWTVKVDVKGAKN